MEKLLYDTKGQNQDSVACHSFYQPEGGGRFAKLPLVLVKIYFFLHLRDLRVQFFSRHLIGPEIT